MSDDFYVGYSDESPPRLARYVRRVVGGLLAVLLATVVVAAVQQSPAESGRFEFGHLRDFEGVFRERPLPLLQTRSAEGVTTNYLLVGQGKRGLPSFARGHHAERVRLRGTLIQKGLSAAIELGNEKSFVSLGASEETGDTTAGAMVNVVLTGELVDTKCYLGVMRPATGKVHRACAARCLSGGVPPGLLVRDGDGNAVVVHLSGNENRPLVVDSELAGREIRVEGQLSMAAGLLRLEVARLSPSGTGR